MRKNFSLFLISAITFISLAPLNSTSAFTIETGGYIDGVNTDNEIVGWAYDPRYPNEAINVQIYIDGKLDTTISSSLYRPDVETAIGITPYRGFEFAIPNKYLYGETHKVEAYAFNIGRGTRTVLAGSPMNFSINDPGVTGYVDQIVELAQDNSDWIHGWVFDNSKKNNPVPVIFYDAPFGTGKYLGSGLADSRRSDVADAYKTSGNHGFIVELDLSGREGQTLDIYAYAVDRTVGELKLIGTVAYSN